MNARAYSHSRVPDQRELNIKFKVGHKHARLRTACGCAPNLACWTPLMHFQVIKFLGKGSYGSVLQVQRLGDGQPYALKVCVPGVPTHDPKQSCAHFFHITGWAQSHLSDTKHIDQAGRQRCPIAAPRTSLFRISLDDSKSMQVCLNTCRT